MKADKWTVLRHFDGFPKTSDFRLDSEELPALQPEQILCQAEYLSLDPYMRAYIKLYGMTPPVTMIGQQVAKVIDSKNSKYPKDSYVIGSLGYRTISIFPQTKTTGALGFELVPDLGGLSRSHALGACGMPGVCAYFGFLKLCEPKEGETVVVTGAAGAIGSLVGQIAKIRGCRVVGFTSTEAKCNWLKSLGFDATINYKTCPDIDAALKAAAPKGVDCYFDNVGGMLSHRIRNQMNLFGRVSMCGSISNYNNKTGEENKVPNPEMIIVAKQLKVEGFVVTRWWDQRAEAIQQMAAWIREGRLKAQETVTEGFHKMPDAFIGMLSGENMGKAIVKV